MKQIDFKMFSKQFFLNKPSTIMQGAIDNVAESLGERASIAVWDAMEKLICEVKENTSQIGKPSLLGKLNERIDWESVK